MAPQPAEVGSDPCSEPSEHGSDPITVFECYERSAAQAFEEGDADSHAKFEKLAAAGRKALKEAGDPYGIIADEDARATHFRAATQAMAEAPPPWRTGGASTSSKFGAKPPAAPSWEQNLTEFDAARALSGRPGRSAKLPPSVPLPKTPPRAPPAKKIYPTNVHPPVPPAPAAGPDDSSEEPYGVPLPWKEGDTPINPSLDEPRPKKRRRGKPRCRPGPTERRIRRLELMFQTTTDDAADDAGDHAADDARDYAADDARDGV